MRICVLGSGSKGNCTYVEGENTRILIDAGLSKLEIEKRLSLINVNPSEIDSILITHEHSDHIAGVGNFCRKYGCKIYAHQYIWPLLEQKINGINLKQQVEFNNKDFSINEFNISNFDLDHDSIHCVGFSISNGKTTISSATDLGHITDDIIKKLYQSDLVILESNHDVEKLMKNPNYPYQLKQRILSNHGHLSNDATANAIIKMLGKKVRGIILAHLSEDNNTPQLAYQTVQNVLKTNKANSNQNLVIDIAQQRQVGRIYKIKE